MSTACRSPLSSERSGALVSGSLLCQSNRAVALVVGRHARLEPCGYPPYLNYKSAMSSRLKADKLHSLKDHENDGAINVAVMPTKTGTKSGGRIFPSSS
jgi:hypothetical protein